MPRATARENGAASRTGRPSAMLITKIERLSTPPTLANTPRSGSSRVGTRSTGGVPRARWRSARTGWTPRSRPGHDVGAAHVHDGSHEQTRRQLRQRDATAPPVRATCLPGRIRRSGSIRRIPSCSPSTAGHPQGCDRADPEINDVARHQVSDLDAHRLAIRTSPRPHDGSRSASPPRHARGTR